jgi:hypothetical protein
MASIVGICNSALIKLGASTITSLTEGSKNANLCAEQYDKTRQALLRQHPWNFAVARAKLAQLASPPAFEFDHAYQLASDWLRTLAVSDDESGLGAVEYRIEGRTILSNADDVYLRYVKDAADPNDMDASFREALAWLLAADLAIAITQSSTTREQMLQGLQTVLVAARSIDAIEDFPESEPEPGWLAGRG